MYNLFMEDTQIENRAIETQAIDDRLQTIEMKLTFLEDFLQRLQDEVVLRNNVIDKLSAEQKGLKEKVFQIAANLEEIPNQKPPHY
jgi:SlyX protein